MSQAGSSSNAISPIIPPDVATSYGTDFNSAKVRPGTAVPSNNKLYVVGSTGIVTEAGTTDAADDTVFIIFANGETTTNDDVDKTILQLTTDSDDGFTCNLLATGYEDATGLVFGARMCVIGKNVGGTASVVGVLEDLSGGDGALAACELNAVGGGAFINVTVKGISGRTIRWTVITPGIVGGPIP